MEKLVLPILIIGALGIALIIAFGWVLGQQVSDPSMVKFLLLIIIGAPAVLILGAFIRAG